MLSIFNGSHCKILLFPQLELRIQYNFFIETMEIVQVRTFYPQYTKENAIQTIITSTYLFHHYFMRVYFPDLKLGY